MEELPTILGVLSVLIPVIIAFIGWYLASPQFRHAVHRLIKRSVSLTTAYTCHNRTYEIYVQQNRQIDIAMRSFIVVYQSSVHFEDFIPFVGCESIQSAEGRYSAGNNNNIPLTSGIGVSRNDPRKRISFDLEGLFGSPKDSQVELDALAPLRYTSCVPEPMAPGGSAAKLAIGFSFLSEIETVYFKFSIPSSCYDSVTMYAKPQDAWFNLPSIKQAQGEFSDTFRYDHVTPSVRFRAEVFLRSA
ncbi:MAG TPA: hypothetical protein VMY05_01900 [Acidobacteriota bacterium]|nr:hypothetical protein [Acidobacteriota bacterium]